MNGYRGRVIIKDANTDIRAAVRGLVALFDARRYVCNRIAFRGCSEAAGRYRRYMGSAPPFDPLGCTRYASTKQGKRKGWRDPSAGGQCYPVPKPICRRSV